LRNLEDLVELKTALRINFSINIFARK